MKTYISISLMSIFLLNLHFMQPVCASNTVDIFQNIEQGLLYPNYNTSNNKAKATEDISIERNQGITKRNNQKQVNITVEDDNINTSERDELIRMEQMAYIAASNGYNEAAVDLYKRILRKQPQNYYIKFGLAAVYQEMGQFKQAKPLYLQLLKQVPDDAKVINNLLNLIIEETPYEAAYLLTDLADKNPKSAYINAQTGIAYQNIQDYQHAYEFLTKATELEPTNVQYRFNLAVVLDKNNQYRAAITNYRMVLSNYSTDLGEDTNQIILKRISYLENQQNTSSNTVN